MSNSSMLICRALIKYGYSNFRLEVLEYCTTDERFARENHYIKVCLPEYNIVQESLTMPSRSGYIHKDSTISKFSLSQPSRKLVSVTDLETGTESIFDSIALAGKSLGVYGSQISNYFLRKGTNPFKGRYILKQIDKPTIEERVEEIESWRTGVEIEVLNLKSNVTTVYPSIRDTARVLGIVHSTVQKHFKLDVPYQNTYVFKKK